MRIIGLTGSVASGKSTAGEYLRSLQFPVIDSDAIVNRLQSEDKELKKKLEALFPFAFSKGEINRTALSDYILTHEGGLSAAEALTLPFVIKEINHQITNYKDKNVALLFIDAPLLFEKKLDKYCDATICIYVSADLQKVRFLKRPYMTEAKFAQIKSHQMPIEQKKALATYSVLSNNLDELHTQLDLIIQKEQAVTCNNKCKDSSPQQFLLTEEKSGREL